MFKKLITIFVAGFMSLGFLAACNLVNIDTPKYYNQIVAEVDYKGETKSFSMQDLLGAYNLYGQQFLQNGADLEDAVRRSLDTLIDRYIFIEKIKETITLSDLEVNELKRQTHETVNKNILEIEDQIREEWGRDTIEDDEEVEETPRLRDEYKPYEQSFELQIIDGKKTLVKIEQDEELDPTPVGEFVQTITEEDISAEAMERFYNMLRRVAESEGNKDLTNEELLEKEINRIYEIMEENKYIEKFQNSITKSETADIDGVLELYKKHYTAQKELYQNDIEAYHKKVRQSADDVYYHPITNAYLNVTHILIKMSPEQNKELENIKKMLEEAGENSEHAQEVYEYELQQIKQKTKVTYDIELENGEIVTQVKLLEEVYNEIASAVNNKNTLVEKAKTFDSFLYMYNDDDGIMNKEFPYAVNLNNDGGANIMIEPFTIASQKLFTEGQEGDISELVFAEFAEGEFGFHIIMNLGVVGKGSFASESQIEWENLWNTRVQPSSEKRIFNILHDQLTGVEVERRMNEMVLAAKGSTEIRLYESRFKNLWS